MQKLALFSATTGDWHIGNLPSALGRAGGLGLFALALMVPPGAAETPANLDAYCTKAYGAGTVAGFDRRDNGPLCTERTHQGLGLLHHKVDPSAICGAQQNTARYRQQGQQIFCLADDETPDPDRKVDLAEYCKSNHGPSAIVSRRLTDNQPLCTVKAGLSQTHHAIDLDEICGSGAGAVENNVVDCSKRRTARGGPAASGPTVGRASGKGKAPAETPAPAGSAPTGRNTSSGPPFDAGGTGRVANSPDLDLSGCGYWDVKRVEAAIKAAKDRRPEAGTGPPAWQFGGTTTPCPGLINGRTADLGAFCRKIHNEPLVWLDSGRPMCISGNPPLREEHFKYSGLDFLWACRDVYPEPWPNDGTLQTIVKFSGRSLECFYLDVTTPPSEPDELVEAET